MNAPFPPPLAALGGVCPDAPAWFAHACAQAPVRSRVDVGGTGIEMLVWGKAGRPGLLLLHGGMAHADWYAHIAPFFADRYRVAAPSWSGMGGSDWREAYSMDLYVDEAMACAEAAGLFAAGPPVFVGHSMGAAPTVFAAARHGERLAGAVVLDSGVAPPEVQHYRRRVLPGGKTYATLEAALTRFRFMPEQPVENLFIADTIARASLKPVDGGWGWRFDPGFFAKMQPWDSWGALALPRCALAFVYGEHSRVASPAILKAQRTHAPAGTPFIRIPDSHHHLMVDQPLALVTALEALLAQWRHE